MGREPCIKRQRENENKGGNQGKGKGDAGTQKVKGIERRGEGGRWEKAGGG